MVHPMAYRCIFFFQAEDGIRDYKVTGVQTCALPILWGSTRSTLRPEARRRSGSGTGSRSPSSAIMCSTKTPERGCEAIRTPEKAEPASGAQAPAAPHRGVVLLSGTHQGPVGPDDTAQSLVTTPAFDLLADQATEALPRRGADPAAAEP